MTGVSPETAAIRRDDGFTLIEMLMVSVLTLLVLTMAFTVLSSTQRTATAATNRAINSVDGRLALTSLEADLRFATQVSVCASGTTTSCTAPAPGGGATLAVASEATPACAYWTIQSSGIAGAGVATGLWRTVGGSAKLLVPGVTPAANAAGVATSGFSLPLSSSSLVEIDLAVNAAAKPSYQAADTVAVHDLIAPDDVTVAHAGLLASGWAC